MGPSKALIEDLLIRTDVSAGELVTVQGRGVELHFEVTVESLRDATEEEIEHGHPHGPGGHHH